MTTRGAYAPLFIIRDKNTYLYGTEALTIMAVKLVQKEDINMKMSELLKSIKGFVETLMDEAAAVEAAEEESMKKNEKLQKELLAGYEAGDSVQIYGSAHKIERITATTVILSKTVSSDTIIKRVVSTEEFLGCVR